MSEENTETNEKKGFFGTIGAGLKAISEVPGKVVDGVTYPTRKLDEALTNRANVLHNDHNDGWARVAEVGKALTGTVDGTARGAVGTGGQPAAAAYSGGVSAINESIDLAHGQNVTLRYLEKQGYGSREELAREFEEFYEQSRQAEMPNKGGTANSFASGFRNGFLGRDEEQNAPAAFQKFKEMGGKMSEISGDEHLSEYLDRKQQQFDKEAAKAPRAIPVEDSQEEKPRRGRLGRPHADATEQIEEQKGNPDLDRAVAQVDTSKLQMCHDDTVQGVANGYHGVSAESPDTSRTV